MRGPQISADDRSADRWAAVRERVLDATLAGLLWTGMAVDLATRPLTADQTPAGPAAYVLTGLIAIPVVVHRRYPILAMLASTAAMVAYSFGRYSAFPGYTTFVLVFAVALHAQRRRALVVYLVGIVGLSVSLYLQPPEVATASSWISTILTATVAWLAGENLRSRRTRRRDELEDAQRQAEQQSDEARRAIAAERLRIARDLHDVVAHSMSVIAVQAGVAHHVIDERPEVARDALGSIEVTAREGLVEMRRLLGLLGPSSDTVADSNVTPVEGLRDVERLLTHFRAAGLRVEVSGPRPRRRPAAAGPRCHRIPDRPGGSHQRAAPRWTGRPPHDRTVADRVTDRRHRRRPGLDVQHSRLRPRPDRDPRAGRLVRRNGSGEPAVGRWVAAAGSTSSGSAGGGDDDGDVAVVDDQALVRAGFVVLLESAPDLEVVGSAAARGAGRRRWSWRPCRTSCSWTSGCR